MPKGPNGQKRTADVIGCDVAVGTITTGEAAEELDYATSNADKASAGSKARAQHLSKGEPQQIAEAEAEASWNKRSKEMTEQSRLMRALFEHADREHMDVKFLRGPAGNLTTENICHEANSAIFQIDNELVDGDTEFHEGFKQVVVEDVIKNL